MTEVEGDPKAPFSIATTLRCRGGCYSISWITPLYPWSLHYNARRHRVPFFILWYDSTFVLLPSDVLLALLLVGNLSRLCIFYHNCKGWSKHSSWLCWIPLVAWAGRDISGELNHLWILSWCHMDSISFRSFRLVIWHRAGIGQWVFEYCPLSSHLGSWEPMLSHGLLGYIWFSANWDL